MHGAASCGRDREPPGTLRQCDATMPMAEPVFQTLGNHQSPAVRAVPIDGNQSAFQRSTIAVQRTRSAVLVLVAARPDVRRRQCGVRASSCRQHSADRSRRERPAGAVTECRRRSWRRAVAPVPDEPGVTLRTAPPPRYISAAVSPIDSNQACPATNPPINIQKTVISAYSRSLLIATFQRSKQSHRGVNKKLSAKALVVIDCSKATPSSKNGPITTSSPKRCPPRFSGRLLHDPSMSQIEPGVSSLPVKATPSSKNGPITTSSPKRRYTKDR
jgi:hypothetical protein